MNLDQILDEILTERARQDDLHPGTLDIPDDGWFNLGARKTAEVQARQSCQRATAAGRLTHAHVFDEEACEVLTAAAEGNTEALKKELIQVAAVCIKWLTAIERRKVSR